MEKKVEKGAFCLEYKMLPKRIKEAIPEDIAQDKTANEPEEKEEK